MLILYLLVTLFFSCSNIPVENGGEGRLVVMKNKIRSFGDNWQYWTTVFRIFLLYVYSRWSKKINLGLPTGSRLGLPILWSPTLPIHSSAPAAKNYIRLLLRMFKYVGHLRTKPNKQASHRCTLKLFKLKLSFRLWSHLQVVHF